MTAVRMIDFVLLSKKDEGARNRDIKYFSLERPLGQGVSRRPLGPAAVGGLQRVPCHISGID